MLERLTKPFKQFGALNGLMYVIHRGLGAVSDHLGFYVYDFMMQPISEKKLMPERMGKGIEVRAIDQGDPAMDKMPRGNEVNSTRFERGACCLGAFKNSDLLAYMWLSPHQYAEDEVRCDYHLHPRDASVFDFDLYVFPEHRLGLAFIALWDGVNRYLYARGVRHTFSRVTRFNTASRSAHNRLGWRSVGSAMTLKVWGLELMFANIAPYASLSLPGSARPHLDLQANA